MAVVRQNRQTAKEPLQRYQSSSAKYARSEAPLLKCGLVECKLRSLIDEKDSFKANQKQYHRLTVCEFLACLLWYSEHNYDSRYLAI